MKHKASKILGVDSSTGSIAWATWYNRRPGKFGELILEGDLDKRLGQVRKKFDRLLVTHKPDFVAIEKAVFVNSNDTFSKLSKIVGVLQSCCAIRNIPCAEITPPTWQYALGNNSWTRLERAQLKRETGKSTAWVNAEIRRRRKQYTIDYMNQHYGLKVKSDNIADALGVGLYTYNNLTRR